jgi:tetratricopeptide (TPR) repeat protein
MSIIKERNIEHLIHRIKQEDKKPIIFLGAGASVTGGIPLASEIKNDIFEKYKDNPEIREICDLDKSYSEIMACLSPYERNELFKGYTDNAKINVTHIYLAQLMKQNFIDYVLTVNFDDLIIRALALYNIFPPIYNMAIYKDLTTDTPPLKSVVYLHGQHHGSWLLNTEEEMDKVKEYIPSVLNSIKNRIWIFIGYSGEDPVFKHIIKLGRFNKGLYWVTYKNNNPGENVCDELLNKSNKESFLIKGYESDSFMLELNTQLGLPEPDIIDKPFTALKETIETIVDINDDEKYRGVKERFEIAKKQTDEAIDQYEKGNIDNFDNLRAEIDLNILKKQIIDLIIKKEFDEENPIIKKAIKMNIKETNFILSDYFNNWGRDTALNPLFKKDKVLNIASIKNFEKATLLNPTSHHAFCNWGSTIVSLAKLERDEKLYYESFEKYKISTSLNPKYYEAFSNWGVAIAELAKLKRDEKLYYESFEKYKNSTSLNPYDYEAFNNWGVAIAELAKLERDEKLYYESFEKYKISTSLNPKYYEAFSNWGVAIANLAKLKNDEKLYYESFEKYKISSSLNPNYYEAFSNWGVAIAELAKLKNDEKLHEEAFEKYLKAFNLSGRCYNLSCGYAFKKNKERAFGLLEASLKNREVELSHVEQDDDWNGYRDDPDFIDLISRYTN